MTKREKRTKYQRKYRRLRSGIPTDLPTIERGSDRKGEFNPRAEMTWKEVDEARRLRREAGWSIARIANTFGLGPTAMRDLLLGLTWREEDKPK